MSRSGYSDDCGGWDLIRWRGAVASAIRGKRGQAALRELAAAMDAMPVKELAAESLVTAEGAFCTLGALGAARGLDMSGIDPEDRQAVAAAFGIPESLAAEIMFLNDEQVGGWGWDPDVGRITDDTVPARRWRYMRNWVAQQIREQDAPEVPGHG